MSILGRCVSYRSVWSRVDSFPHQNCTLAEPGGPLKPYFCSWATRKFCESYTRHPGFHRFSAQGSLQFFLEHSFAPRLIDVEMKSDSKFISCGHSDGVTIQLKPLWFVKICNLKILLWPVPIRSGRQGCHWDLKLPGKYNKNAGNQTARDFFRFYFSSIFL